MRRRFPAFALLVASALSLLTAAFFVARSRSDTELAVIAAAAKTLTLRQQISEADQRLAASEAQSRALNAKLAALEPKKTFVPATGGFVRPTWLNLQFADLARNHPELWDLSAADQTAAAMPRYGSFLRQLDLNDSQTGRFRAILTAYYTRLADLEAASDTVKPPHPELGFTALTEQAIQQKKAEIVQAFGDDAGRQLEIYERTSQYRSLAQGLAQLTAFTEPLSRQQVDQLTQVLANASPANVSGPWPQVNDIDWSAVDSQAKAFLTLIQYAAWTRGDVFGSEAGTRSGLQLEAAYQRAVGQHKTQARSGTTPAP